MGDDCLKTKAGAEDTTLNNTVSEDIKFTNLTWLTTNNADKNPNVR
jgi:hypothetical protein